MRKLTKQLGLIILLQAACLALGFWIHGRIVLASARWAAKSRTEEQAATGMANAAGSDEIATDSAGEITAGDLLAAMPASSAITFVWTCFLQSVLAYMVLARMHGEHSKKQMKSDEESLQKTKDLIRTRDAVIFGLAKLAESRDSDTGDHLDRIAIYATCLASACRRHPKYRDSITPSFVRLIGVSSALHDIGKVAVEDSVLLKPGKLTADERFRMQLHANIGGTCIQDIEKRLGTSNFLEMAREIAFCHHERWDGTGYPNGLAGEDIPLAARVVSIADVYDALSVRRVYKEPFPHDQCVAIIRKEAGKQFDPDLVNIFLKVAYRFREIADQFSDLTGATAESPQVETEEKTEHLLTPAQEEVLISAIAGGEADAETTESAKDSRETVVVGSGVETS